MEARVYIDEDFFDTFQKFKPEKELGVVDAITENKNQLINILSNSELNSPIQKKYFINLHKKLKQNYKPDNLKDYFFFKAFRNNKLKIKELELESPNSIFFTGESFEDTKRFCEENNVISFGRDYDFQFPIMPKSSASMLVDKNMKGIECVRHRCRNVVMVEPYLFQDQHNFEPKIPNFIRLLKELYLDNNKTKCYLSIVTNRQDNDGKFNSKIKEIKDGMSNINLEVSVYAHKEGLFHNNRHFITDYSIIDSQHLFDRDEASVSVNYLYSGNINSNFNRVKILKDKIIANYKKDPEKMGIFTRKFGDILNNPMFQ